MFHGYYLWQRTYFSLSPFAPENLVSQDGFGRPVPRQPAHSPHSAGESGALLEEFPSRFPRLLIILTNNTASIYYTVNGYIIDRVSIPSLSIRSRSRAPMSFTAERVIAGIGSVVLKLVPLIG